MRNFSPISICAFTLSPFLLSAIYAQAVHGTTIIAVDNGAEVFVASDTLSTSVDRRGSHRDPNACKIFSSGKSVLLVSGVGALGNLEMGSFFLRDPSFGHTLSPEGFETAVSRWSQSIENALDSWVRANPADFKAVPAAEMQTFGVFLTVSPNNRFIHAEVHVSERITVGRRLPIFEVSAVTMKGRMPPGNLLAVSGDAGTKTWAEIEDGQSFRSKLYHPLWQTLKNDGSTTAILSSVVKFVSLASEWYPEHSGGQVNEAVLGKDGFHWISRDPSCTNH